MKVDLSENEIKIINEALDCWEKENSGHAFNSTLMGAMFARKDQGEEEFKTKIEKKISEASAKDRLRKNQAILLRAKLIRADNVMSEHCGETIG